MDWWNVSVFGVIPVLTVLLLFCVNRKNLWSAPIISTILTVIISLIAMPTIFEGGEAANMLKTITHEHIFPNSLKSIDKNFGDFVVWMCFL